MTVLALIDVIQFNGIPNRNWLVYRYPGDNFVWGTQLVVKEGQIAVFVKGGRALDYFSAGTHTLNSQNIPLLQSIINIPFGGRTPFTAEVYFINKTAKLDMLWGTSDPISLIDPKYSVRLRVRAFGQLGMRISDYRVFLTELIGAVGNDQVVKYDLVVSYFKGVIITKVKSMIADIIINQKISVLEIAPRLEEVSGMLQKRLTGEFERFGIEIVNFFLSSVNFPDEDFETINKILGEKAAFDIIGDNRYNVKRSFDVMETAAGNEGSGSLAAAGIGIGLGAGAGVAVGGAFAGAAGSVVNTPAKKAVCRKCGAENAENARFCSGCGEKIALTQVKCHSCGESVDEGMRFCSMCGASMAPVICPGCKKECDPGTRFCPMCGTKFEEGEK